LRTFFSTLSLGARVLILIYALGYPLALAGHYAHQFELYDWLGLSPAVVWRGEVWRVFTYAFLAGGVIDWVVSLFWLATLVSILGRNWSARELWGYCLLTAATGALVFSAFQPGMQGVLVCNGAMAFGLLAAWYRLYGSERLIMLGLGEFSVRQAAVLIAFVDVLILFFCLGLIALLAMMCGGLAGWLYLFLRGKYAMNRRSQTLDSERIARLEL